MTEDFEARLSSFKQNLEELSQKVQAAADLICQLKAERDNLRAELEFLREENKQARLLISDNEKFTKNQIWLVNKMEKILKKIEAVGI